MSHSHAGGPTADVSVRIAWADDAEAIAAVQVRAWPELYAGVLPAEVLPTDVDAVSAQWRQLLARPADARNRVLVALERNRVVGFTLTSPALDPDCDPVADGETLGGLSPDGRLHLTRSLATQQFQPVRPDGDGDP